MSPAESILPSMMTPDWVLDPTYEFWITLIFGLLALQAVVQSLINAKTTKSMFPIFLFLGCGLAVFYEPMNDLLGHCFYSENGMNYVWIEVLGRKIPTYIGFCFIFYYYQFIWYCMNELDKGVSKTKWLQTFAWTVLSVQLFEVIPISLEIWGYYGDNQPLKFWNFPPLWWGFVNTFCLISIAMILHLLRRHVLRGNAATLIGLSVPILTLITHAGAAMPTTVMINMTENVVYTSLASLVSIAITIFITRWAHDFKVRLDEKGIPDQKTAATTSEQQPTTVPV